MSFQESLNQLRSSLTSQPQKSHSIISSFRNLFYEQLKKLITMFEQELQKNQVQSKGNIQKSKNVIKVDTILALYSVIILRSQMIILKTELNNLAVSSNQKQDGIYNSKLAIEILTKIFRSLEEEDVLRCVVTGLLLKIKNFSNYKMVAKYIDPKFISSKTMDLHFFGLKNQCPNLLEAQLMKFKETSWSKYLSYKNISLNQFHGLLHKIEDVSEDLESHSKLTQLSGQIKSQTNYLLNRLQLLQQTSETQKIDIDQFTTKIQQIQATLTTKLKETLPAVNKKQNKKSFQHTLQFPDYDLKQFKHQIYLNICNQFYELVQQFIEKLNNNWFRKIKWLFEFVMGVFANFNIKENCYQESIALEYCRLSKNILNLVYTYFDTFKPGLFPSSQLNQLLFTEQYSIYKLIEAILYNQYIQLDNIQQVHQNFQKQRKQANQKQKQSAIDLVNINMKTLNLNPHYDNILSKFIPNLKNSSFFVQEILVIGLQFFDKYYEVCGNYEGAAKFLTMVDNAKNSQYVRSKSKVILEKIKKTVYPEKMQVKEGLEYFCEEYFKQDIEKRQNSYLTQKKLNNKLKICSIETVSINNKPSTSYEQSSRQAQNYKIKKTQSKEAMIQGWEQFQSIDSSQKRSINGLSRKGEVVNNQIFYSIKESQIKKESDKNKKEDEQFKQEKEVIVANQDQILIPEF